MDRHCLPAKQKPGQAKGLAPQHKPHASSEYYIAKLFAANIRSVVLGTLFDPFSQDQDILPVQRAAGIQARRHLKTFIRSGKQLGKGAGLTVAGDDDWPELGSLHQALVCPQIQPTLVISLSSGNMAVQAIIMNDRLDVILEADLFFPQHFESALLRCARIFLCERVE